MFELNKLKKELNSLANPKKAKILQGFFKTCKGEYGEGDIFLGIVVPKQRLVAKKYSNNLNFNEIQDLLNSKKHEYRLVALLTLIDKCKQAKKIKNEKEKKKIFNFYLSNTKNINKWDLVDLSCRDIVGDFLLDKDKNILYKLAKSNDLWEKRIAII